MSELTCVIIGGGHAGIHAAKAVLKKSREGVNAGMIDKQPCHVRKVMLFQPAARGEEITVPWASMFPEGVRFVQGTVTKDETGDKRIRYLNPEGTEFSVDYDNLVVAIGSVVRRPDPEAGGIALTGIDEAVTIRKRWRANMRRVAAETNAKRLLTVAFAGAGISGVEAAAGTCMP